MLRERHRGSSLSFNDGDDDGDKGARHNKERIGRFDKAMVWRQTNLQRLCQRKREHGCINKTVDQSMELILPANLAPPESPLYAGGLD